MKPITVLLAEDHPIVRHDVRAMRELEEDIRVIGEAGNGRQAVASGGIGAVWMRL